MVSLAPHNGRCQLTNRMTARQLRLLGVLGLENVADTVEKFNVALLGVGLERRNEGPRHGTSSLSIDGGISPEIVSTKKKTYIHTLLGRLTKFGHLCCPTT